MIGRILWEGCANGRSACSAGSLCKRASWKGCKTKHLWLLGKERKLIITPERGTADSPPEWPSGAQDLELPWRTPGCPRDEEEEEEERRGCTNRLTARPGRAAQQPVPKLQNKSFPGTQPRGRSANESSAELPRREPPAPAGGRALNLLGGFGGEKRGGWEVEDAFFHLEGLGWDEPSPGREWGGGNVASLHGGRSSPASLRVSGPLVKGV